MTLPGFTADTSLYRSIVLYQAATQRVGRSNRAVDLAQLFLSPEPDGIGPIRCHPHRLGCGPDPDNPGACCQLFLTAECDEICGRPCTCPTCTLTCAKTTCCPGSGCSTISIPCPA